MARAVWRTHLFHKINGNPARSCVRSKGRQGLMETKFTQFLRAGGNGEFLIRRRADAWVGMRTAFSIKSEFPNYAALRDNFAARLDAVIQSNTAMLLQAISAQYDPPLTAAELPGVGGARADNRAGADDLARGMARSVFFEGKVSGLTWHHDGTSLNPDGTGPMLLLDERAHKTFGHVGWASTINE